MKKIIKIGNTHRYYKTTCICNCEFVFESSDMNGIYKDTPYLTCPDCGDYIYFTHKNKDIHPILKEEFEAMLKI